jgi:hypothetical protein
MKIGILVDGQAEFHSLPLFLDRVDTQAQILKPLYCDMQPFASYQQIAYVAMKRVSILLQKGVSKVVVLIDKEQRGDCAPLMANSIEEELEGRLRQTDWNGQVSVVVKVDAFENWLVADPHAFVKLTGMFKHRKRIRKAVEPDKADNVDALAVLNRCCVKGSFSKVKGAKAICQRLDPTRAATNSRSFRRFLRVLGDPAFSTESKNPPG